MRYKLSAKKTEKKTTKKVVENKTKRKRGRPRKERMLGPPKPYATRPGSTDWKPYGGQPQKYKPEYCEALIKHMSQGYSFETFAATIKVSKSIVYHWANNPKTYPGFAEAKDIAETCGRLFWERIGMAGMLGYRKENGQTVPLKNFNAAIWIFSMRARFPKTYNQPRAISISQRLENDLAELQKLSPTELAERAEQAAKYLKEHSGGSSDDEENGIIEVEGKNV